MTNINTWHHRTFTATNHSVAARYTVVNRHGGSSTAPFSSLNVGLQVNDDKKSVLHNRRQIQEALGLKALFFVRQVHGVQSIAINSQHLENSSSYDDLGAEEGCDALITTLPEVGLAVQHADCQAVLLYDPTHSVIAAIHCGWRGNVQNIIGVTIEKMQQHYSLDPASLHGFIGPSLGPCCAEFVNYTKELPEHFYQHRIGDAHFDFHAISRMQLAAAGVADKNITSLDICTCCSKDYFSYRRSCRQNQGKTGRNCTVISLTRGL